eukprot:CAMPEP_0183439414 /NCGR_PEP_ID=MMETSP0370-20130417/78100_1 /TAXON_ID=268820 /ORGANISM="Peridinium aciculiferum, Strain PAER-2" /LENGTH=375 /DNA_ID=CAMNT_0025627891 /DNA_START=87 /DNA_END=1214 /DNA_ORIENTATION=+
MAPMKRPAAASSAPAAKRPAAARKDPVPAKVEQVGQAMAGAEGFPEGVVAMLVGALPCSLALLKDERHATQEEVIKMAKQVLDSVTQKKEVLFEKSISELAEVQGVEAVKDIAVEDAKATVAAKAEAAAIAKDALQEAAGQQAAAQAALNDATSEQHHGDSSYNDAATQKVALEEALDSSFAQIKAGTCQNLKSTVESLLEFATQRGFEPQLLLSAEPALSKAASERGNFDVLVLDQFEAQLMGQIAPLAEQLSTMEGGKAERQAKVDECRTGLEGAEVILTERKAALSAALEAEKEAKVALKAAEAEAKAHKLELKAATAESDEAAVDLAEAKAAVEVFLELESRVPFVEPVVEEAAPMEEEPAAEEAAPAAAA